MVKKDIPDVDDYKMQSMIDEEAKCIAEHEKRKSPTPDDDKLAASRLRHWYWNAEEEVSAIKENGLTNWISYRRRTKVWATLLGLKDNGITDLPL